MKLKNQVVNLELSNKLKELGVRKEGLWWWKHYANGWRIELSIPHIKKTNYTFYKDVCFTFTVAELGEMLKPKNIDDVVGDYIINGYWDHKRDSFDLDVSGKNKDYLWEVRAKNEANARAKILIWLIENKHVSPKELL